VNNLAHKSEIVATTCASARRSSGSNSLRTQSGAGNHLAKLLFKPYDSQSKGHIKASPVDTSALNEARIQ
jgi:hypothetical protein